MNQAIVIGGGVVGASAAYHLAREGIATVLIDRRDAGHATRAGAGIIAPGTSQRPLPAFFPFAAVAVRRYPDLIASLAEIGQTATGYDVVGEAILAFDDEEAERLGTLLPLLQSRVEEGMPNLGEVTIIDDAQARTMFPPLGRITAAIHVPEAARVDGDRLRNALVAGAEHYGARVMTGSARLLMDRGQVTGVELDGAAIAADAVVVAAGAWTNRLLEPLGLVLAVEPQRGQILHLSLPDADTSSWAILGGFSDQYMLTFGPNQIVAGATREHGSGYDVRMTVGGVKSVVDQALKVAPGLTDATVSEVRVGLRPLSADGLPFLGRAPGFENVIIATGHGPSGLQLGPYSGLVAAQLVLSRAVEADLGPFAVGRAIAGNALQGAM